MSNESRDVIRVGSRKSQLALIQTNHVIKCLKEIHPECNFEIVGMNTKGDKILNKSLPKIGEKALFTQELETALENGQIDFIVHSLKDLPTTLPHGMALGAILKREDPRDAVVMSKKFRNESLESLPRGSVIGTSSLRRSAQLARNMAHLKVQNIRGNLNTRLQKLDDEDGPYDAIILAAAGLKRMGWDDRISQILEAKDILYAVGQGALGVECREFDWKILKLLEPLFDVETTIRCVCERSFLRTLGGGCSAPVAVVSTLKDKELTITGAVWSLDGSEFIEDTVRSELYIRDEPEEEKNNSDDNDDGQPPKKIYKQCPYQEPRLYCSVKPGKVSGLSLLTAEKIGQKIASNLIKKNALEIMSKAREEILSST